MAILAMTGFQEQKEILDGQGHRGYPTQDHRETQGLLVRKASREIPDGLGPRELQDLLVRKASREIQDGLGRKELQDLVVRKASREIQDGQDREEQMGSMESV